MRSHTYPGNLYMMIGPSGAGKSTLLRRLIDEDPHLSFSVSYTTRAPRHGEVDGKDYFFIDRARFEAMIKEGAFLEWAEVHANCYGTSRAHIVEQLRAGEDVLLDVDVQGAINLKRQMESVVAIFVAPPNVAALRARLEARGKDSAAVIERRLKNARGEMEQMEQFDFLLVNDDLDRCYDELRTIVAADRLRLFRRRGLAAELLDHF
ncbi:guanylate kinase [Acanthopleuribacter pedis]|uniref:Guanylate kinase n=1 Tax=Acanthopleuribacter pedis TaxID=442870 RepID=A0A8J7Q2S6_9BACT|nr:guanylate kinase [Acanthopleuribacter pedis]MBO1317127.1 guanylate kinase [Acanthopleuribacter pedis]